TGNARIRTIDHRPFFCCHIQATISVALLWVIHHHHLRLSQSRFQHRSFEKLSETHISCYLPAAALLLVPYWKTPPKSNPVKVVHQKKDESPLDEQA
ncbi:MAG: hypothetical protein H8D52_04095, partial [Gammaproteobacteria bacterium]|nr:hypothetical protein [Gammaproteobacteria bacterium]